MRTEPTWRIPAGVLALVIAILAYSLIVVRYISPLIDAWHTLFQVPVYIFLGIIWLFPLRRFLIWMETGNWK